MAYYIFVEVEDYDELLKEGDEVQIHLWLKPNSESRIAVADGIVRKVIEVKSNE